MRRSRRQRLIDLVGRIDLLTAAAALRRCALFIGNDTGLMHIAAAAGTPTLGLFGPSPIEQYAPWGSRTAVVRTAQPPETMFGPGLRPPHHRHADGQPVGRDGRSGGAPALPRDERRGVSALKPSATAASHPNPAPTLSALVVAHNEAEQLAECLAGLAFADEIVVVARPLQ